MIVGITGTVGAGKGAVVQYLIRKKGFRHYSARVFLTELMEKEGIPINRNTMIDFANELRRKYGPEYIFTTLCGEALKQSGDAVIESIRTLGEVQALKARGGMLLAINADREKRYARIHGRGSALDMVSFDEFKVQEERELTSTDMNAQNLKGVMALADVTIENNGSLADLHQKMKDLF